MVGERIALSFIDCYNTQMRKILTEVIHSPHIKKSVSFLKENKKIALAILLITIFADIFFIETNSDIVIFSVLILYFFTTKVTQVKSRKTFLLCLALLCAMFISYLLNGTAVPTEKAAVWLVLFMALGIYQQWRE